MVGDEERAVKLRVATVTEVETCDPGGTPTIISTLPLVLSMQAEETS